MKRAEDTTNTYMALNPEIPVIYPPVKGKLHVPTNDDPETGILESIKDHGKPVVAAGGHTAIELSSLRPHHPNGSEVLWIVEQADTDILPWSDESWINFSHNSHFLLSLENHIKSIREKEPGKHAYFFIGFVPADKTFEDVPVYPRGLQSQKRAHIHITDPITTDTPHDRLLDLSRGRDALGLALLLNEAGEHSIRHYEPRMAWYGEKFLFHQPVKIEGNEIVSHTMFGFNSLEEALNQSLVLLEEVKPDWIEHAKKIPTESLAQPIDGVVLRYKQTAVPCVIFILPTEEDRRLGRVKNDYPVWTMPFAVSNVQFILSEGGVIFDHSANASQGNPVLPK